eukprot:scaffold60382_cov63-Phaeocystis_antarctica.AAC.1
MEHLAYVAPREMGMGMGMRMRMRARLAFAFACLHTSTLQHAFLLLTGGHAQSAHATRDPALCHVLATYQVTGSCDVLCEVDCLWLPRPGPSS